MKDFLSEPDNPADDSGIYLTPMLDVVFIMLIFFIVTASFVKELGFDVNRPRNTQQPPQKNEIKNILLTVAAYGQLFVNRRTGDAGALTDAPKGCIVEFVRVPNPPQLRTEQLKPKIPIKSQVATKTPQIQNTAIKPTGNTVNIGAMDIENNLAVDTSTGLSASDNEYLPIAKVAPINLRRAQTSGMKGWARAADKESRKPPTMVAEKL